MATIELTMPALGQSVAEGTVVRWLKQPGEAVALDESVVVVQTDKAETEIPSPVAGTLAVTLVEEGRTVAVGTALARLEAGAPAGAGPRSAETKRSPDARRPSEAPAAGPRGRPSTSPLPAPSTTPRALRPMRPEEPLAATAEPAAPQSAILPARPESSGRARFLSPAVRRLAREHGLDARDVLALAGSGRAGRVTHADLSAWVAGGAARPEEEIVPLTGLRLKIAEHMIAAKRTAPHVNTVAEADMSAIEAVRRLQGPAFKARHGFALSYNALLLKASAEALAEFPVVNAILDQRGIVTHRSVHLGMAVALEPAGLVVPVIRNAHRLTVREMALEAKRLSDLARERKLGADDMAGGTCTVTNPGVFGNLFGTPIIHLPQAAIIDFGAIKKRVIVTPDDAIAIRPMCYVVVAWDHRVMDGATAARFLQRLVRALETFPAGSID